MSIPTVEQLAERRADVEACEVPLHIVERVSAVGKLVAELIDVLDTAEQMHETYPSESIGEADFSKTHSKTLDKLVADGVIDARVAEVVALSASGLVRLHEAPENISAANKSLARVGQHDKIIHEDSDTSQLHAQLFVWSAKVEKHMSRGDLRFVAVGKIPKPIRDLLWAVDETKAQGHVLVDSEQLALVIEDATAQQKAAVEQGVNPREVQEMTENTAVLKALCMIEIFKLVDQLPEATVKRYVNGQTDTDGTEPTVTSAESARVAMAADIIAIVGKHPELLEVYIDQEVLAGEPRTLFGRKLKGANAQFRDALLSVGRAYRHIEGYEATVRGLMKLSREKIITGFDDIEGDLERKQGQIGHNMQALEAELKRYIDEDPTAQRVLGALAVEHWVADLATTFGYDGDPKELIPLHEAILTASHEEDLRELQAAIAPLMERIEALEGDKVFAVTSESIRNLGGGKQLKRSLEAWEESGSNRNLFNDNDAKKLAGIALGLDQQTIDTDVFAQHVRELFDAWADLAFLQGQHCKRSGLVRLFDTLREWHEAAPDKWLNQPQLKPVWSLAREIDKALAAPEAEATAAQDEDSDDAPDPLPPAWMIPQEFAHLEFIEPFPPGETNAMVEDLVRISQGYHGAPVEWERIHSLIQLKTQLEQDGFRVESHRLMQTAWHSLPHYVLEVTAPNGSVVAIVESPIYGHATYLVPSGELGDWREIVGLSKEDVRALGRGIAKIHAAGASASEHRDKLRSSLIGMI